jgi:hypothetical protein
MTMNELEAMVTAWEKDISLGMDDPSALDRALGCKLRREPVEHSEAKVERRLAGFKVVGDAMHDAMTDVWLTVQQQRCVVDEVQAATDRRAAGDPAATAEAERLFAEFRRLQTKLEERQADLERLKALHRRVCEATSQLRLTVEEWYPSQDGDDVDDEDE